LIVTTLGLVECVNGAILYDKPIRQQKKDGTRFVKVLTKVGVIPGIKVDAGAKDLAGHPGEPMAFLAVVASRETRTLWLVMPPYASKPDWSQSPSRKCLWTAIIPWSGAAR
jgi:hypothetical protein